MGSLDDVIRRVASLKRLAAGAGTPEEAAAAAAKAQELMFAHNIAEAQVDARAATADDLYVNERGIEVVGVWRQRLLTEIASTNFCRSVYSFGDAGTRRQGARVSLIGRRENIEHVLGLWRWLVPELEHMASRAWAVHEDGVQSGRTWKNSYYHGAVGAILGRLRVQRLADEMRLGGASTALIVVEKGLDDALDRFYPNLERRRRSGYCAISEGGFAAGRRDASAMRLDVTPRIA